MKKMHVSELKQDKQKVKNNNNHSLKFSGDTKEGSDLTHINLCVLVFSNNET